MFKLGLYFKSLGLTMTKVFLNQGLKSFVIRAISLFTSTVVWLFGLFRQSVSSVEHPKKIRYFFRIKLVKHKKPVSKSDSCSPEAGFFPIRTHKFVHISVTTFLAPNVHQFSACSVADYALF